jgi:hypothetical protein
MGWVCVAGLLDFGRLRGVARLQPSGVDDPLQELTGPRLARLSEHL